MDTLEQTAPDRIEIRSGGGVVLFFGFPFPFLATGVYFVLIGAAVVEPQNADDVPGAAV